MANNRMLLCYRPSGRIIGLGKRMGFGWYNAVKKEKLDEFFAQCEQDALEVEDSQDAFCLLMENDQGLTDCFGKQWVYDSKESRGFDFVKFED